MSSEYIITICLLLHLPLDIYSIYHFYGTVNTSKIPVIFLKMFTCLYDPLWNNPTSNSHPQRFLFCLQHNKRKDDGKPYDSGG